jgi:hypothetical protein
MNIAIRVDAFSQIDTGQFIQEAKLERHLSLQQPLEIRMCFVAFTRG